MRQRTPNNLVEHKETVTFESSGHVLVGHVYKPKQTPSAIAVLNGALGVRADFYDAFATWLAEEMSIACLIYDYRDFGASATGPIRDSEADFVDWAVHDAQAARDFAGTLYPGLALWVIGHSMGAIGLPFQKHLEGITRVIAIGSGATHVSDHPWPFQGSVRLLWSGPMAALCSAIGYLPGNAFGLGADIPLGVFRQWRRWSKHRGYFDIDVGARLPRPDVSGLPCDTKFIEISDDQMVPRKAIWRLMSRFSEERVSHQVLRPRDFDLETIGHIGVFSRSKSAAWKAIMN